jgi:hypothetical protein
MIMGRVSQIWDMGRSISQMVAPYLAGPRLRSVVDHDISDNARHAARPELLTRTATPATRILTLELDGAARWLGVAAHEILLAALGRTIARTIGDGVVAVQIAFADRWIPLPCATVRDASPTQLLARVRRALAEAPPPAEPAPSEVVFNYTDGPDTVSPTGDGRALELRAYRRDGLLHLDWWYDTRKFDRYTVEELAEQFPLALIEVTSEAVAPI